MAVDLAELRGHVERDSARASELISKANQVRRSPALLPVDGQGMNPSPQLIATLAEAARDRDRGLRQVENDPFFAKVETSIAGGGKNTFYISKARNISADMSGADWIICSWTSPAPSRLLDQPLGHEERIVVKITKGNAFAKPLVKETIYRVGASAKYGAVFPRLRNAEYLLPTGEERVADSEEFLQRFVQPVKPAAPERKTPVEAEKPPQPAAVPSVVAEAKPPEQYKAADHFGLSEIIALTSVDQRAAMHLPFGEHVMIEGPPGSGKTSIGIMRIPCLIDQQWDDLGLQRGKDEHRYRAEWTRVLVLNPEMVPYLRDLITSLLDVDAQGVKVSTFREFFRQVARDCRTLAGREADEGASLSRLKGEPAVLHAVWAGYREYLRELWEQQANTLRQNVPADIAAAAVRLCYPERVVDLPFEIVEVATALAAQNHEVASPSDQAQDAPHLPLIILQEAARNLVAAPPDRPSSRWQQFRGQISELADSLWMTVGDWYRSVQAARTNSKYELPAGVNLAVAIAKWCSSRRDSLQDVQSNAARGPLLIVRAIEDCIRDLFNKLVPSVTRLKHIPALSEFGSLLKQGSALGLSFSELSEAHQAWRTQLEQTQSTYSEQDAVLGAWLGSHLAMLPIGSPRRIVGHEKEKLTHILISHS
ncbi:MAG: hypothetical protein K8T91_14660 [Planctomycetes bacterium]|nr:hypothetical protein [Planctomycetota bacterium]